MLQISYLSLEGHPLFYLLLTLHCLIGLLAAIVAHRKGFSFQQWLIWGLIGGTAALAIVLVKQPQAS